MPMAGDLGPGGPGALTAAVVGRWHPWGVALENQRQGHKRRARRSGIRGRLFGGALANEDHPAAILAALVFLDMDALAPQQGCRLGKAP